MSESLLESLKIDRRVVLSPKHKTVRSTIAFPVFCVLAALSASAIWMLSWAKLNGSLDEHAASGPSAAMVNSEESFAAPTAKPQNAAVKGGGSLSASGYVVARRKSTVGSEISGKIAEVVVDEGDIVEKGDVIARLDDVLAKFDRQLAQSRVVSSEAAAAAIAADLADAQRISNRTENLLQRGAATEADRTKNRARLEVLDAQYKQALAATETARVEAMRSAAVVEKSIIRAPLSGIVVERNAEPGEMISAASAGGFTRTGIVTLASRESIEFEVDVNQTFLKQIRLGQKVDATLDSYPEDTIPSHVKEVSPAASREKGTVKIRIVPDAPDARILPDMAVTAIFKEDHEAIATDGGPK
jgi:RND family efflux transporter MFP subunit